MAEQVKSIMGKAVRQSDRYRALKLAGASDAMIKKSFHTPTYMSVFTYHGDIDTIMTRWTVSDITNPSCGRDLSVWTLKWSGKKAHVGGLTSCISNTTWPWRVATGGLHHQTFLIFARYGEWLSPCDKAPNVQRTYRGRSKVDTTQCQSAQIRSGMVTLKWDWLNPTTGFPPIWWVNSIRDSLLNLAISESTIWYPSVDVFVSDPCDVSLAKWWVLYTTFANHGIRCAQCSWLASKTMRGMWSHVSALYEWGDKRCQCQQDAGRTDGSGEQWYSRTPSDINIIWRERLAARLERQTKCRCLVHGIHPAVGERMLGRRWRPWYTFLIQWGMGRAPPWRCPSGLIIWNWYTLTAVWRW